MSVTTREPAGGDGELGRAGDDRVIGQADGAGETGRADGEGGPALRDLLITMHTPALGSGRALRTYGLARALSTHRGLDLRYVRFGEDAPDTAYSSIPGIELIEVIPSRGLSRLASYAAALGAGVPASLARGVSAELAGTTARLAAAPRRGRVIADGPTAAAALLGLASGRPVIYNAHNLESSFRHELQGSGWTLRRIASRRALAAFERKVLSRFAESWMVSEADMAGALELCPSARPRLRLVPNVVDVAAIRPVHRASDAARAIFVGSFSYPPNRAALRFLLDEVMPRLWSKLPQATLTIVGGGLGEPPSRDPRVEALGYVEDLDAIYEEASCAVVPLLQGGGTPLKLIEALAHGLPVVATPRAAAGLQLQDGRHCLIAERPQAFADAMERAMRQDAAELAANGRRLVEQRYSIEALAELLAPV